MFFNRKKRDSESVTLHGTEVANTGITEPPNVSKNTTDLYYIDSNNQPSVYTVEKVDYKKDGQVLKDFLHRCSLTASWISFQPHIRFSERRNESYSFYKNNENVINNYLNSDFVHFILIAKKENDKKINEIITILKKDIEESVPLGTYAKIFALSVGKTTLNQIENNFASSSSKKSAFVDDDGIEYLENMVSK